MLAGLRHVGLVLDAIRPGDRLFTYAQRLPAIFTRKRLLHRESGQRISAICTSER
jgi:hypothetical protein